MESKLKDGSIYYDEDFDGITDVDFDTFREVLIKEFKKRPNHGEVTVVISTESGIKKFPINSITDEDLKSNFIPADNFSIINKDDELLFFVETIKKSKLEKFKNVTYILPKL